MEDQFTEEVKKLRDQGESERQMAAELHVSRSKIHNALQGLKLSEISSALVPEDKIRAIMREELKLAHDSEEDVKKKANGQFPVMRKMGGGMEVISPEAVLHQYMGGGTPEEQLELRAIMKFRAAMLMVMDLVNVQKGNAEADARRMEPILRLMKETREEQDSAAVRAKASSEEIAERAAQATASQLFGAVSQNNAQVTGSLDQIKQMVGGKSDDPFTRIVSMMQSMQNMAQMFGMPLPGMTSGGPAAPGSSGAQSPVERPPIERHSINELEGK